MKELLEEKKVFQVRFLVDVNIVKLFRWGKFKTMKSSEVLD